MFSVLRLPFIISILALSLTVAILSFIVTKPSSEPIGWDERDQNWQGAESFYNSFEKSKKSAIIDGALWGLVVSEQEAEKRVNWSVKAIVDENEKRFFIADISPDDTRKKQKTFSRFTLNDTLPDGGVVTNITKDSVVYELDGKRVEKHLYESTSSSGEKRS